MISGRLPTKIVGVRYYKGHATPGEHVILVREPANPYDRNAIQDRNVMGAQIGHIPRTTAVKLAGYMVRICGFICNLVCSIDPFLSRIPESCLLRAC